MSRRQTADLLVALAGALRRKGVRVTQFQLSAAGRALTVVDAGSREQVYWALRSALLVSTSEVVHFDPIFDQFWVGAGFTPEPESGESPPPQLPGPELSLESAAAAEDQDSGDELGTELRGAAFSSFERLRELDLATLEDQQLRQAERLARRAGRRSVPRRRSRRSQIRSRGRKLAFQATLRQAMRTEAHPLELTWQRPRSVARPLVFLIDVSGSMEAYARPFFAFAGGARESSSRVEAFAFGTRLTRLSGSLRHGTASRSVAALLSSVPDWAGGTRIGESLAVYSREWGRRGMSRSAVVVIVSDGWERGSTALLGAAMAEISRQAHSVVWANPLAGDPGYEPLAAGMATALEWVDVFLPGQSLKDLDRMALALSELGSGPARKGLARSRYDVVLRRYTEENV